MPKEIIMENWKLSFDNNSLHVHVCYHIIFTCAKYYTCTCSYSILLHVHVHVHVYTMYTYMYTV